LPAIEARDLAKSFSGRRALWDLSFSVERGEVFGLLGPNGAGKTTTLRILAGLIAPDSGSATVAGCEVRAGMPGSAELRGKIGLLTEQPGFYDRLTARENLVVFGKLQGLTAHEAGARGDKLMSRFALAQHATRPFAVLSRGMKQKLAIARALLHDPEVILLDEPTVGLDPEATREVRELIGELAAEKRTLVLCTHHLHEVERLCARSAFVAGRLLSIHDVKALGLESHRLRISLSVAAPQAEFALRRLPFTRAVTDESRQTGAAPGTQLMLELEHETNAPDALAALIAAGGRLLSAVPARAPLEEAYLALLAQARKEGLIDA
jgi:ABC-2 type transport system ATP-binding protein